MGEDSDDLFSADEARAWLADDLRFAPRLRVALRGFISLSERADAAESALQCETQRHKATRAAVREYLTAIESSEPISLGFVRRCDVAREALRKIVEGDR